MRPRQPRALPSRIVFETGSASWLKASNGRGGGLPILWRWAPVRSQRRTGTIGACRVYAVPLVGWSQDAWDTAKSAEMIDHMGHDEVAAHSDVYGEIAGIRDFQSQEL